MIVILEYKGESLLIKATPIGRNGYHDGKVIFSEPSKAAPLAQITHEKNSRSAPGMSTIERIRAQEMMRLSEETSKEIDRFVAFLKKPPRSCTCGVLAHRWRSFAKPDREPGEKPYRIAGYAEKLGLLTISTINNLIAVEPR